MVRGIMRGIGLDKKREETLRFRLQPDVDPAQLVTAEAVTLIYAQSRISMIVHVALAPIMAYLFSGSVPPAWIGLWGGLLAGAVLIRLLLVRDYLRSDIPIEDIPRWERRFVLSLVAVGALWGLPGLLFAARLDATETVAMAIMLLGLSGGSLSAFGHHRLSHIAFTWPLIGPFTLHLLLQTGTSEYQLIGLACLLYLVLTTAIVSGYQRSLRETLATSYKRLSRVGELTRISRQLEQANQDLDERNDRLAGMNDLLSGMLDNSHVMMAFLDRDFRFQFVNEAYAAAGRRPADAYIGQRHFALYPDPDNERIFREALINDQPYRADAKPFSHPGQPGQGTAYRDVDLLPVHNARGETTGLLLSLLDVTDKTRALKQLAEREIFLSTVLETMGDGLVVADASGRMLSVTAPLCRMYGYDETELTGRNVSILVGGHDRTRHDSYLAQHVVRQEKTLFKRTVEGEGVRRDGTTFPVEVTITEMKADGNMLFVGTIRDISERRAILAELRQQQDKTEAVNRQLTRANEALEFLSTHDSLTGLPNRRHFDAFSERLWRHAIRHEEPVAILMIDIDFFKRYNDHYGHLAGDVCLRQIGELLGGTICRPDDIVARYGGEEFIAMLGNTGTDGATRLANALLDKVRQSALPNVQSEYGVVTLCIGMAVVVPDKTARLEYWVQQADEALYRAKMGGRNCLTLAATPDA